MPKRNRSPAIGDQGSHNLQKSQKRACTQDIRSYWNNSGLDSSQTTHKASGLQYELCKGRARLFDSVIIDRLSISSLKNFGYAIDDNIVQPPVGAAPANICHESSAYTGQPLESENVKAPVNHHSISIITSRGRKTKQRISDYFGHDSQGDEPDARKSPKSKLKSKQKSKLAYDDESDFAPDDSIQDDTDLMDEDTTILETSEDSTVVTDVDDEPEVDRASRKYPPFSHITGQKGSKKVSSSGVSVATKKKATKFRMVSLTKGALRALDTSLKPLSNIHDIFADMTANALKNGLNLAMPKWSGRAFRVATMCSGTESPLLALQLIQDALNKSGENSFDVVHLFSAEIVPAKQAYIERNFSVPVIFRDITELTKAKDSSHEATTAYGAKVEVPGDLHLVIAGTACVDYSLLNNKQKALEDNGESGDTFRAVLAYARIWRPKMLILENVFTAPWDEMLESYEAEAYAVAGVLLDTKTYYLPQTRQRGYMLCIDKQACTSDAAANKAAKQWTVMMAALKRNASSPASEFMLPSDDPTVLRARALLARRSVLDKNTREVDWSKCAIRHIQYRREENIGNARPYTSWQESGSLCAPDYADHSWMRQQVERVWDMLDCSYLRKAHPAGGDFDIQYKSRIINVSQNVDRNPDSTPAGIAQCITPSGIFFVTNRGATLSSHETIALQGLPLDRISFTTETSKQIQDLAGNAMSSTVVGAAILSAIAASASALSFSSEPVNQVNQPEIRSSRQNVSATVRLTQKETRSITQSCSSIDISKLSEGAAASCQKCSCEGPYDIASKSIQTCLDCGHTSCLACGGKPAHRYGETQLRRRDRANPGIFKHNWEGLLPSHLQFTCALSLFKDLNSKTKGIGQRYADVATAALEGVFEFQDLKRSYMWTAIWQSPYGRLCMKIKEKILEWELFAHPPPSLPVNHELRLVLSTPIARGRSSDELLNIIWQVSYPDVDKSKTHLTGMNGQVASWHARLNLPGYENERVWNEISMTCSAGSEDLVEGTYVYLPKCGTASECLYKRQGSPLQDARFLMLDPDPIAHASDDFCVLTDDPGYQQSRRRTFLNFPASWRPWNLQSGTQTITTSTSHQWKEVASSQISLHAVEINIAFRTLAMDNWRPNATHSCRSSLELLQVDVPTSLMPDLNMTGTRISWSKIRWLFLRIQRQLGFNKQRALHSSLFRADCHDCTPPAIPLRWKWSADKKALKPYEDAALATKFEESIKGRPQILSMEQMAVGEHTRISISLNVLTLLHRALGKLRALAGGIIEHCEPTISWTIDTAYFEGSSLELPEFSLRNNDGDMLSFRQPGMEIELWPLQQKSLAWMLEQESGEGVRHTLEEVEELLVPEANWRIEVTARSHGSVRGGIQASHPGFGKTICTLALVAFDFEARTHADIVAAFSRAKEGETDDAIELAASLVVAPKHLVSQWASEVNKVLGKDFAERTLTIASARDLETHNLESFKCARIIVVNQEILTSETYVGRLAAFAGVPGPSSTKGRQYETWLGYVNKSVVRHARLLESKGIKAVKQCIRETFRQNAEDPEFESVVPSKRHRGQAYVDRRTDSGVDSDLGKRPGPASLSDRALHFFDKPLFEMFRFNRLVVDEFTYLNTKDTVAIENLKADKRWALSATAKLQDPYDIARMAGLIGIRLRIGESAPGAVSQKNLKRILEERTDFEQFQTFRTAPSVAVTRRTYKLAQEFLDSFVRQNILEFDDFPYQDRLVPVRLTTTHRLVYTELSQHLNGTDMKIIKGRKVPTEDRDRDTRIMESLSDVHSAEEALSRLSAIFDGSAYNLKTGIATIESLIAKRQDQERMAKSKLASAIADILSVRKASEDVAFQSWKADILEAGSLGDKHATNTIRSIFENPRLVTDPMISTKGSAKTTQPLKDKLSILNVLAKQYMAVLRSIRFAENAQSMMEEAFKRGICFVCDYQSCGGSSQAQRSVSSLCGHIVCDQCWALSQSHTGRCDAAGCTAPVYSYTLLKASRLDQTEKDTKAEKLPGMKIRSVIDLLQKVSKAKDQAIMFVHYEDQISELEAACKVSGIKCIAVRDDSTASQMVERFQTQKDVKTRSTVIILNASNSSAAGINLANANHVIFLSPLLTDSQYTYDAAMAQAIGRARRPGQTKDVHVYRFVSLDTIDVDILEHRERRATALSEIDAPEAVTPGHTTSMQMKDSTRPTPERTQLIRDKGGHFHLLPKSWLVGGDKNGLFGDGIEGRARVAGYEDFSSLVKFSKAYSEDD